MKKNKTYLKGIAITLALLIALAPCLGNLSVYADNLKADAATEERAETKATEPAEQPKEESETPKTEGTETPTDNNEGVTGGSSESTEPEDVTKETTRPTGDAEEEQDEPQNVAKTGHMVNVTFKITYQPDDTSITDNQRAFSANIFCTNANDDRNNATHKLAPDAVKAAAQSRLAEGYTVSALPQLNGGTIHCKQDGTLEIIAAKPQSPKPTVTYQVNGDKPSNVVFPETKEYEVGDTVAVQLPEGYVCQWTSNQVSSGDNTFVMPEENVTIEVTFEKGEYKVNYLDENNKPIKETKTVNGFIGQSINEEAPIIYGYKLIDSCPAEVTGTLTKQMDDINFIYEKEALKYQVKQFLQNAENDGYSEDPVTEYKFDGHINETVTASPNSYDGFFYNSKNENNRPTGTITAENEKNMLVLKLYYDRNKYPVTYEIQGAPAGITAPGAVNYKYGASVTLADVLSAQGYTFSGWQSDDVTFEGNSFTMPNKSVTIKGSFNATGDTPYTVKHYKQTANGGYELADTDETGKAAAGTTVHAVPNEYEGFKYNSTIKGTVESGVASADGTLVLKLYYNKVSAVTYEAETLPEGAVLPETKGYESGESVDVAPTVPDGYTCTWTINGVVAEPSAPDFVMPANPVTITVIFTPNEEPPVTPPVDPNPEQPGTEPDPVDPSPTPIPTPDPTPDPVVPTPTPDPDPTPDIPDVPDPAPTPDPDVPDVPGPVEPVDPVEPDPVEPVTPNPAPAPVVPATPAGVTPAAPAAVTPAAVPAVAALTPVPAAAPAAPAPVAAVPDDEVPLAAGPEDNQGLETLKDGDVPLAGTIPAQWALLNLILAVLTVLVSVVLIIGYFSRKREDEDGEEIQVKKKGMVRALSILPALAAVILFFVTEDMSNPMVFTDKWTLWMVLIAVVNVLVAFLSRKSEKDEDNNQGYGMA